MSTENGNPVALLPLEEPSQVMITQRMHELYMKRCEQGLESIHVGFGQAVMPMFPPMMTAHQQGASDTRYSLIAGHDALRKAFAERQSKKLGLSFAPEQVFVGPGSKPLLFSLFTLLPGDAVLLPRPSWPAYAAQVRLSHKSLIWVETDPHDRHTLTVDALDSALQSAQAQGLNPRVILVCTPNSPTGSMMSPEQVSALANWCKTHGVYIVSDEIYSDLLFDPVRVPFTSPAQIFPEGTILTHGISKTFSAGGWRMGAAVVPATETGTQLVASLQSIASDVWSCTSNAAQSAALAAYTPSPDVDTYIRQCSLAQAHCALRLARAFVSLGLPTPDPKGGFYLYPSFHPYTVALREQHGVRTSAQLSMWLLEKFGIITVPGSACGEVVEDTVAGGEDGEGTAGGRLRLRIATSMLLFPEEQRDTKGWEVLRACEKLTADQLAEDVVSMPLLDRCIQGFTDVVRVLKA